MFVDVPIMRAGANRSYEAASHAQAGGDTFGRATPTAGIFGDFDEAKAFSDSLNQVHSRHVGCISNHVTRLGALGDDAHQAANGFADMDADHAETLRAVGCTSST